MPGMVKKSFFLLLFVSLFSLPVFADDLYITYTMPALRSFQDGLSYDAVFDGSGNMGNLGYAISYDNTNWWYMTYAMPNYSGTGSVAMKEHLINVVGNSSVVSFSDFGLAGESSSGSLGTWYYPGYNVQKSNSHQFSVNNSPFYVVGNDISFTAYNSYGLSGTDYVRLGHVTSPKLRLGFDNDIVYDGSMFGGSLTMIVPYEVTPDNYVTTANLNSAVSDLKATIEANAATSIDYTDLLNQINTTMSSINTALTSSDTYPNGLGTLYYYVRYMFYNLEAINDSVTSIDSTLDTMSSTLSLIKSTLSNIQTTLTSMEKHISNIDDNLQYIADEFRAQDELGQAAAGAAGDQTEDTLSNSQSGLSGINTTISDSGSVFTDLSGNGFSGFLGATFGTVLTASPTGASLTFKKWILLFITLSAVLLLVRVFLMGGDDD